MQNEQLQLITVIFNTSILSPILPVKS